MQKIAKLSAHAHRALAAIYICLDRNADARVSINKMMKIDPYYTIENVREALQSTYKNPLAPALEGGVGALRAAGLPE